MNLRTLLLSVILCAISAHAGYFLENPEPEEQTAPDFPAFSWGGGLSAAYYLGSLDFAVNGLAQYRLGERNVIAAFTDIGFTDPVQEAGLDWHWFFNTEDYIGIGASGVIFKKDTIWYKAPRISLSYGREILPWKKAHFALHTSVRLSYLIGESLGRKEEYATKTAQTVIHGTIAVILF